MGIQNLFDLIDQTNLNAALYQNKFIFGMETFYGEPVTVKIYFDSDSTNDEEIKKVINTKHFAEIVEGKQVFTEINFQCKNDGKIVGDMDAAQFRRLMFESYDLEFNDYSTTEAQKIDIFEIGLPEAEDPLILEKMPFLVSALSSEEGLLRIRTIFTVRPMLQIFFDKDKLSPENIESVLLEDTLTYYLDENTTATTPNIFTFEQPSKVVNYLELVEDSSVEK